MAKRMDDQKRLLWTTRLERFRAGGLSVARFCDRENIAVHSFYYWSRQLRPAGFEPSSAPQHDDDLPSASQRTRSRSSRLRAPDAAPANTSLQIHIRVGTHAQVSIPVDCLAALRCVVNCLRDVSIEPQEAFQHLFVGKR